MRAEVRTPIDDTIFAMDLEALVLEIEPMQERRIPAKIFCGYVITF